MTDARLAISSAGSREQAEHIARLLVEAQLAACVNVVPGVTSYYRWKGKLERAEEWLLIIKTTSAQTPALEARIRELHTYECPEFSLMELTHCSADYLEWLVANVREAN